MLQLFEQPVVQLGHELSSRRIRGEVSAFESLEPAPQIEERVRVLDSFALEHFADFATPLLVLFVSVLNAPLSRPYRNHQALLLFDGGGLVSGPQFRGRNLCPLSQHLPARQVGGFHLIVG